MRYASLTETGKVRNNNEDSCHADGRIFIVADGMGGHRAGEVASAVAIERFLAFDTGNRQLDPLERIKGGILSANMELLRMAREDPGLEGMGTTFTCVLAEEEMYIGHVGDSRAYLWRKGDLTMLTRDHSLVERMVREGYITRLEARVHPQRNIILRALGVSEDLEVDLGSLSVDSGDRLLICSDGLTGSVEDDELEAVISKNDDPAACCRELVDKACEHGGTDNITVVTVYIDEGTVVEDVTRSRERKSWWRSLFSRSQRHRTA